MIDRNAQARLLRAQEQLHRSAGLFEAAVTTQRHADHIEAGDPEPPIYSVSDRGAATGPCCYMAEGLFVVVSSDGAARVALTEDRALALWESLTANLDITPAELKWLAGQLEDRSAPPVPEVSPKAVDWFPSAGTWVSAAGDDPTMVIEVRFDDGVVKLDNGKWVAISCCESVPSPKAVEATIEREAKAAS